MSISGNPKKVLKKVGFFGLCDENALKIKNNIFCDVSIIFLIFFGKKV
jgi:hypothetical protein